MAELLTLFDLYKAVGEHLAGTRIILKFQQPGRPDADGQLTRLLDNRALIEVIPYRGEDRTLKIFLHELAHIRLHWKDLQAIEPSKALAAAPGTLTPGGDLAKYPTQENQADALADKWLQYANEHRNRNNDAGPLENKLLALLEMTP